MYKTFQYHTLYQSICFPLPFIKCSPQHSPVFSTISHLPLNYYYSSTMLVYIPNMSEITLCVLQTNHTAQPFISIHRLKLHDFILNLDIILSIHILDIILCIYSHYLFIYLSSPGSWTLSCFQILEQYCWSVNALLSRDFGTLGQKSRITSLYGNSIMIYYFLEEFILFSKRNGPVDFPTSNE